MCHWPLSYVRLLEYAIYAELETAALTVVIAEATAVALSEAVLPAVKDVLGVIAAGLLITVGRSPTEVVLGTLALEISGCEEVLGMVDMIVLFATCDSVRMVARVVLETDDCSLELETAGVGAGTVTTGIGNADEVAGAVSLEARGAEEGEDTGSVGAERAVGEDASPCVCGAADVADELDRLEGGTADCCPGVLCDCDEAVVWVGNASLVLSDGSGLGLMTRYVAVAVTVFST